MSSIKQIHLENTGKVSHKWESYLEAYDIVFKDFKNKEISLLEIGVQNGGSLETWYKYFINAYCLVGCDIDQRCSLLKYDDPKIHIIIGNINDRNTYESIKTVTSDFDIVIDDGSHMSNDVIGGFINYFPLLKPNGVYVIEDTHTSFWNAYGGGILKQDTVYSFFKKMIDVINIEFWNKEMSIDVFLSTFFPKDHVPAFISDGWIDSIEFRNSMIIIKKSSTAGISKLGNRLISGNEAIVDRDPLTLRDFK